jgi:hypothetical protein
VKYIIVIPLELDSPELLGAVVAGIDPLNIEGFTGQVLVAVDPVAQQVIDWLEEK